jgi:hypothetical protein
VISVRVSSAGRSSGMRSISRSVDVRRGRACSDLILPLGGAQDHTTGRGWATCCAPAHPVVRADRHTERVRGSCSQRQLPAPIDAFVTAEARPFWRAVLGYQEVGDEYLLPVAVDLFQRTPSACDTRSRAGTRPGGRVGFRDPGDGDLKREREPSVSRDGRSLVVGFDVPRPAGEESCR